MIAIPASLRSDFIHIAGTAIHIAPECTIHITGIRTVVSTFTLCTIPGVVEAIKGMGRVLKPSGKLIFFEHGLSPDPRVRLWQERSEPLFRWAFEGCHVTRDIPSLIGKGGFKIEQMDAGYLAPFPKSASYCWWAWWY
jgi:hypothetical protein